MDYLPQLKIFFGFDSFLDIQQQVVNTLLEDKKNVLLIMPTGSGKSLCYQFPAMVMEGRTIIISPLIALMQDQVDKLRKAGLPATFINSSITSDKRERRLADFVDGKTRLLYVTPERFRKTEFIDAVKKTGISLLAVDEAHCISEWGHDFRPDYSRVGEFRELLGNPLTIALTATATPEVQNDIIKKLHLENNNTAVFHRGIERENLFLGAFDVYGSSAKFEKIISVINSVSGAGIIYFSLIKTLDEFSAKLTKAGIKHGIYHGNLSAKERKMRQNDFIFGNEKIMLATNAFGMGVDKPDIRFVIHAELPGSIESYYQEIGRAGRDGKPSFCYLLYDQNDLYIQMDFIKWSNPESRFYYSLYELLKNRIVEVNSLGLEFLRENLVYKNRTDFRLETALGMLDRYGATEGDVENRDLKVVDALPLQLSDEKFIEAKIMSDRKKLLSVVNYFKAEKCRKLIIFEYFGITETAPCNNCDICHAEE